MKEKKLVWDLDGCLRDLSSYLVKELGIEYPKTWNVVYKGTDPKYKDMNFYKMIDTSNSLIDAPRTEYFSIVQGEDIEIWTTQPKHWRERTKLWIATEFMGSNPKVRYFDKPADKRAALDAEPDTWLVEDNPTYEDYDRMIIIDRPYNQEIAEEFRVKTPTELELLWELIKLS